MICSPAVVISLQIGDELHELVCLPVEVEVVERLEGERRVANPRVPVVPLRSPPGVSGNDVVSAATVAPVGMYVSPLIASAARWITGRNS